MHSSSTGTGSLRLVLILVAISFSLFAQTTSARIVGTIRDQSGASLAGATVTVTDVQRGISRTVVTDESGAYVVPSLAPGTYAVKVEAPRFKTVERPKVEVEVASDLTIDLSLPPGEVKESVLVESEVPLVNAESATLGGTLSNKEINDLPLNGRNYENLLQLRPGVVRYPGGGFSTTSTNGLRAEDNVYLVDGLFNSEPFSGQSIINGAGIAGDSATILPIDAIQEFNVQQNPRAAVLPIPSSSPRNVGERRTWISRHDRYRMFGSINRSALLRWAAGPTGGNYSIWLKPAATCRHCLSLPAASN